MPICIARSGRLAASSLHYELVRARAPTCELNFPNFFFLPALIRSSSLSLYSNRAPVRSVGDLFHLALMPGTSMREIIRPRPLSKALNLAKLKLRL